MKYKREINKLEEMLSKTKANYKLYSSFDGFQIILFDNNNKILSDAICHSGSYGHENDLLEICGLGVEANEDIEGYLTAEEVFQKWQPYI